ncbi:MAG: hypothetical protein GY841_06825 [FCB group bacterium]|nr:hypothetical protein [FCB group bacterium]
MRFVLLLAMSLVCSLVFVMGCSDDETTNPVVDGPAPGDSTFVSDLFDEDILSTSFQSLPITFALLEEVTSFSSFKSGLSQKALQDDEIIIDGIFEYEYSAEGWHVFDFSAILIEHDNDTQDTVDVYGSDSVQIFDGDSTVQFFSGQVDMDTLKIRAHVRWYQRPDSATWGALNHSLHISIDSVSVDTFFTITGSVRDTLHGTLEDDETMCQAQVTNHQVIEGLKFSSGMSEEACPLAGHIVASAGIDLQCSGTGETWLDSLNVNGSWTITATVNENETVTLSFTNGVVSWTITQPCGVTAFRPMGWMFRD